MQNHNRNSFIVLILTALAFLSWFGLATFVVPRIITDVYYGKSLPFLNTIITGQSVHSLEKYLDWWQEFAKLGWAAVGAIGLATLVTTRPSCHRFARSIAALPGDLTDSGQQPEPSKILTMLREMLIFLFIAFMIFAGQIQSWTDPLNRYHAQWEFLDGIALILDVIVVGLVGFGLHRFILLTGRLAIHRGYQFLCAALLFSGLLGVSPISPERYDLVATGIFFVATAFIVVAFYRRWSWPLSLSRRVCLILSPVVPIMFAQILTWGDWPRSDARPSASQQSSQDSVPVLFFIFDAWSYHRTLDGEQFAAHFPNLRELSAQACVFTEARSPADHTTKSLPRLLFQSEDDWTLHDEKTYWKKGGRLERTSEVPSLLGKARSKGYRTYLFGWYHNYKLILGDQADCVRMFNLSSRSGKSVWTKMSVGAVYNLHYQLDPLSRWLGKRITRRWHNENTYALCHQMHAEVRQFIEDYPKNTFAFFHLIPPHYPFVFNADGSFRPGYLHREDQNPKNYRRQLQYLDKVVGEFITKLKAEKKFAESLIIISSDHSWKGEPDSRILDYPNSAVRVPLIIKLPRQENPLVIGTPIVTNKLETLIWRTIDEGNTPSDPTATLREMFGTSEKAFPKTPPR